ncbi:hypothetical protein [Terrabacter sp. MAHUQ-38]|uniref:hypothetical protein n=1 Tax=unclassified Terrabacter TaxID=2630222 RepID=UPI00165E9E39|nr:hypothetical protein [Terrabacter sp. MAHUQ-38]MBC9820509.1 hypothetical protein [Terrabacter sp. MAHUQ-38]
MGWQRAYPYAEDDSALVGTVSAASPGLVQRSDGTWDAFSEELALASFAVEVKVDEERLAACLPDGLSPDAFVEIAVRLTGLHSRQRRELRTWESGQQNFTVDLDPMEYVGKVDLDVVARLKAPVDHVPGFAHLAGSVLARAELATIWFSEPPKSIGDTLEVRWEDFDNDGGLVDGQLFTVRMEERPVILLNSAVPSAYDILSSKGTWGAAARIRDAVYAQIVHQAWSSILSHCFMEVVRHDEGESVDTVLAELEEWQAQVLRAWAPAFEPGESDPDLAVSALVEEVRATGSLVVLQKLPEAIQANCVTISGFNGLVKEFDRFQKEPT